MSGLCQAKTSTLRSREGPIILLETSRSSSAERRLLEAIYLEALQAVDSGKAVARTLRREGSELWLGNRIVSGRLTVLAAGKAAGPMAATVEGLSGDRIDAGLVVTRDGLSEPLAKMAHLQGDHPLPGPASAEAARRSLELIQSMPAQNTLLVLLSGGASSLLFGPPPGVRPEEIHELNRLLLASGADIAEVNRVRRCVSICGGGKLAAAATAHRIEVLVVSDVPHDRIDVIGSGPFVPHRGGVVEARACLRSYAIDAVLSPGILGFLERAENHEPELELGVHRGAAAVTHHVVASNRDAVHAALEACSRRSIAPIRLTENMRGEACRVGRHLGALGRMIVGSLAPTGPHCMVLGGETTVTVTGEGIGGRSQELALSAAIEIAGQEGLSIFAAGTDGSDGPTDAAGAYVDGNTIARGLAKGVDALDSLSANDSHGYFSAEGGLVKTGPTGTNVMDLALVLLGSVSTQR